jgi:large subunit ribosomal protein L19
MDLMNIAEQAFANEKVASFPKFKAGDTITVNYRIKEGDKDRLQKFRGVVLQLKGATPQTKTFTVRKISGGIGVERIFPLQSPFIDSIELNKVGKVRRARIFYLRKLSGKKARIKERKFSALQEASAPAVEETPQETQQTE